MIPNTYDALIEQACMAQHFPMDWRALKAQLYQESLLKPDAISPAGAQGLAQMMPTTWPEVRDAIDAPKTASPFDPQYAIPGAAWYMWRLYYSWSYTRTPEDRWRLALASYNAGIGNICKALRSVKLPQGLPKYGDMIFRLHEFTGANNALQTSTYVDRVENYYRQLTV